MDVSGCVVSFNIFTPILREKKTIYIYICMYVYGFMYVYGYMDLAPLLFVEIYICMFFFYFIIIYIHDDNIV